MDLKTALSKLGIPVGTRTVDEIIGSFTKALTDLDARDKALVEERDDISLAMQELVEEEVAVNDELVRARRIKDNLSKLIGA